MYTRGKSHHFQKKKPNPYKLHREQFELGISVNKIFPVPSCDLLLFNQVRIIILSSIQKKKFRIQAISGVVLFKVY